MGQGRLVEPLRPVRPRDRNGSRAFDRAGAPLVADHADQRLATGVAAGDHPDLLRPDLRPAASGLPAVHGCVTKRGPTFPRREIGDQRVMAAVAPDIGLPTAQDWFAGGQRIGYDPGARAI